MKKLSHIFGFLILSAQIVAQTIIATDVTATRKLKIPATTSAVSTNSTGSLKIDTDGPDANITQSLITYWDGTRIMYGISVDTIPSTDDYVLAYDGTAKKFVFQVQAGGAGSVSSTRQVLTTHSLTGGGDLSADRTLSLVNDSASPGNNKVYGTDGSGVRGWKNDPAGGGISITGTPVSGNVAEWTSASAIQGVGTTGSGNYVRATSPTFVTPNLGTVASGVWNGTQISVFYGGTGAGTFTDGGVLIGNSTGAIQATSAGTIGQVLVSNGAGVDPTFGAVPTHTHAASDITSGTVATARLGSGTANSSTFLRGDQTWATPAGGGDVSVVGTPTSGQAAEWTGSTTIQGVAVTGTGSYVKATAPTLPSTVTIGAAGGTTGAALFKGTTSGTVTLSVADAAGTYTVKLPTDIGASGDLITTDGVNQLDWVNTDGTGPVTRAFTSTVTDWTLYNSILDTPTIGDPAIERAKFTGVGGSSYIYAATGTTTSHTNYLPTTIGTAKQLLNTDGSGQWSWVSPFNTGVAETTVASATTTDLGAVASDKVSITGTTTITGFGTVSAGTKREGRFTGALTLTHNATSLILPGNASISTAAGDRFQAYSLGSGNWVVSSYTKADGTAVVGGGSIADDSVTNAKMANMSASTIKARVTGSTGDPEDATLSQVLDLVGSAANGDMLVRSGGSWGRLAAPTQLSGSTLYYGPGGVEWVNPDTHFIYRQDFNIITSTAPGDFGNLSSSGSVSYMDPGANGIGGMNMSTGTTTTGYRHQFLGTGGSFAFGYGRTIVSWRVKLLNLSDGADTYTAMAGVYDAVPSPVDGVWFQYSHSVNSGKWECKVADNSATTTTDSGVTVAANTWYTMTIDVNASATEAKFYINGTLVHTESGANIPQTGRVTTIGTAGITKSAGTTARVLSADYLDIYVKY